MREYVDGHTHTQSGEYINENIKHTDRHLKGKELITSKWPNKNRANIFIQPPVSF